MIWTNARTLMVIPMVVGVRLLMNVFRRGYYRRTTALHELGVMAFVLYLLVVISVTQNIPGILAGYFRTSGQYNLTPFAGIRSVMGVGLDRYAFLNIVGNVGMFVPLGLMVPLLWRGWSGVKVILLGCVASIMIETLQFFTGRGLDIDDVLLNTLGAALGYGGYSVIHRLLPRACSAFRTGPPLKGR